MTYLVSLDDSGDEPLNAVYKPAGGERSLWDFPDGLFRREVAAFTLSEALGWGLVPPTVLRPDGPFGEGSLQLFVEADYNQHYFTLYDEGGHEALLQAMCAFDIVANNADRKSGHVLKGPDGRLWGIDHGLCFHRQPKLRTVIWDFAEDLIPKASSPTWTAWPPSCPTKWRDCSRARTGLPPRTAPATWSRPAPSPSPRGPASLSVAAGVNPTAEAVGDGEAR